MEELQDNILRVLDVTKKRFITQQEAWNELTELELITKKQNKNDFLISYLTLPLMYKTVFLKIVDNKYYLYFNEKDIIDDKTVIIFDELQFSPYELTNIIVKKKLLPNSEIIDSEGNTVQHYIIICGLDFVKYTTNINDLWIKNKNGDTPYDITSKNEKLNMNIFVICTIERRNNEIRGLLEDLTYETESNAEIISLIKQPLTKNKFDYRIIYVVLIALIIKFFFF
jgi:hypothetical protein